MPSYSKKEFAQLCNLTTGNLSNYITRGNVVLNDRGEISTDDIKNKLFLEKRQFSSVEEPKTIVQSNPVVQSKPSIKPRAQVNEANTYVDQNYNPVTVRKFELENAQKEAQLIKTKKEIAILDLKEQKQRGEVIPTDIVKPIMAQHFKSITTEFKNGAEQLLVILQSKHNFTREQMAEYRGVLIKTINASIKSAVLETEKSIQNIVSEYSSKKGIGEHE